MAGTAESLEAKFQNLFSVNPQVGIQAQQLWTVMSMLEKGLLSIYEAIDILRGQVTLVVQDTDTIILTLSAAPITGYILTGDVVTQMSLRSDVNGIRLDGDEATPGNSEYYGTNGAGAKGFYALPASVTPGGANTQIQFNDSGVFGGDGDLVWNKTTNTLTITGTGILSSLAGVGTRMVTADASGTLGVTAAVTQYTDEMAQDAVGSILDTDYLEYDDLAPGINFSTRSKAGVNIANFLNMD